MTTELKEPTTAMIGQNLAGKYLTFILGGESYAIPGIKVREIIRLTSITAVTRAAPSTCGRPKTNFLCAAFNL